MSVNMERVKTNRAEEHGQARLRCINRGERAMDGAHERSGKRVTLRQQYRRFRGTRVGVSRATRISSGLRGIMWTAQLNI